MKSSLPDCFRTKQRLQAGFLLNVGDDDATRCWCRASIATRCICRPARFPTFSPAPVSPGQPLTEHCIKAPFTTVASQRLEMPARCCASKQLSKLDREYTCKHLRIAIGLLSKLPLLPFLLFAVRAMSTVDKMVNKGTARLLCKITSGGNKHAYDDDDASRAPDVELRRPIRLPLRVPFDAARREEDSRLLDPSCYLESIAGGAGLSLLSQLGD